MIRDADDGQAEARSACDERGRRQPAIRGSRVQVKIDHGSHGRLRARPARSCGGAALPFDKQIGTRGSAARGARALRRRTRGRSACLRNPRTARRIA